MICRICFEPLDIEHPMSFRGLNPRTFRIAWMHSDCFFVAYDELLEVDAKNPKYSDRQDEYQHFKK